MVNYFYIIKLQKKNYFNYVLMLKKKFLIVSQKKIILINYPALGKTLENRKITAFTKRLLYGNTFYIITIHNRHCHNNSTAYNMQYGN